MEQSQQPRGLASNRPKTKWGKNMNKYVALYQLPLPPTKELATKHGEARYYSLERCSGCKKKGVPRYVATDACYACLVVDYMEGLQIAIATQPDEKIPRSAAKAVAYELDYFYTGWPCDHGEHPIKKNIYSGQCETCIEAKKTASPRLAAIAKGETKYLPLEPCDKCQTIALRRVDNGRCDGCQAAKPRERTPDRVLMDDCPDIILDKESARSMGFKVYRTGRPCKYGHMGFRNIAAGACITCK